MQADADSPRKIETRPVWRNPSDAADYSINPRVPPEGWTCADEEVVVGFDGGIYLKSDPRQHGSERRRWKAEVERRLAALEARAGVEAPPTAADAIDSLGRVEAALSKMKPPPPAPSSVEGMETGLPQELADQLLPGESLGDAASRLTPGIDELLNLEQALSPDGLEKLLGAMDAKVRMEWVIKLNATKADLRTKRGTDMEDFPREGQVDRLLNVFASVGAKR